MKQELEIDIYGRVQGVGFRDNAKKVGESLKLKGFVENKEDGSVNILAQGEEEKLKDFLKFIQDNPGFSKVEGVSYKFRDIGKEYPDFRIIRKDNLLVDQAKAFANLGRKVFGIKGQVPKHISIIPDGNRRWAKKRGFEGSFGHYKAGAYNNLRELINEAKKLGIKYFSIWGFSTENWKREEKERKDIFDLILSGVEKFKEDAEKNRVSFKHIGRKDRLPRNLIESLNELEERTKNYKDFFVLLLLDYGGRDEIIRVVNRLLESGKNKIDESEFLENLDTAGIPEPDLIIRTSGEHRTSGFLPVQSVYSELYFVDKYFPDFTSRDLKKAIEEFGKRKRRYGK